MCKKLVFVIYLQLLLPPAFCINTDSLDRIQLTRADTVMINRMIEQGYTILETQQEDALKIADWGIAASEKTGNKRTLASAHLLRGRIARKSGIYDQAIYHYLLSLKLYEQLHDHFKISSVCNSIGIIYMNLGNFHKTLKYEQYALEHISKVKPVNYKALTDINNQIGAAYFELGMFEKAYSHFMEAHNTAVKGNDQQGMAIAMDNLTRVYAQNKQFDKALESARQSIEFARQSQDSGTMAFNLAVVAHAHMERGEYNQALQVIEQCEKVGKHLRNAELNAGLQLLYAEYYKRTGNYKKALEYYEKWTRETNNANLRTSNKRIAELESMYEVEKKNAAYALLKKEKDLQETLLQKENAEKRALFIVAVVILCGTVVVVYYLVQKHRINKRLAALNEEKSTVMSILSHDLRAPFTKVHTLVQLIAGKDSDPARLEYLDKIDEVVRDGTDLIQNLLDTTYMEQHRPVVKTEDIDILELMQLLVEQYTPHAARKQILIEMEVDIDELTIRSDRNMLKRIIDNLLSNAIKYSYSGMGKRIWLSVTEHENLFVIEVKDEGQGIDQADIPKLFFKYTVTKARPTGGESSNGMGLYITKQLCEWLGGYITVKSKPGSGSSFIVSLPRVMAE
jgi:signal transduction histidine kinase/Tfp pilus assembly protein PilF